MPTHSSVLRIAMLMGGYLNDSLDLSPRRSRSRLSGVFQPVTPRTHTAGRNDPCLCQSGKKFKKCCLNK